MAKLIDLHTHSTASDGSLSPAELVRRAKQKGLSAIAITDHDTMDGVAEAMGEGKRIGVEVIAGVEISVDFEPEMHMLGYFFGSGFGRLEKTLVRLRKDRDERNPKIINRLNRLGFDINMDEVEREARGEVAGRAHIAKILYEKGYVSSMEEAFDKYLSGGKPAYVKRDKLTPEQGIREIENSGGIPVLAHPIYLGFDLSCAGGAGFSAGLKRCGEGLRQMDEVLHRLGGAGLKGLEAYYSDNSPEETENLLLLARRHNMLVTGGSDFHGRFREGVEIGTGRGNLSISYDLLERLKNLG